MYTTKKMFKYKSWAMWSEKDSYIGIYSLEEFVAYIPNDLAVLLVGSTLEKLCA